MILPTNQSNQQQVQGIDLKRLQAFAAGKLQENVEFDLRPIQLWTETVRLLADTEYPLTFLWHFGTGTERCARMEAYNPMEST